MFPFDVAILAKKWLTETVVNTRTSYLCVDMLSSIDQVSKNALKLIGESVQERRNSTANALESRLSCTNPSKFFNI